MNTQQFYCWDEKDNPDEARQIKIFDYPQFAKALQEKVRENAEGIAKENGTEIEFIRKLVRSVKRPGSKKSSKSVANNPALFISSRPWKPAPAINPGTTKTPAKPFSSMIPAKCLHYYFYFIDKTFGLCYLRVPTWTPFRLQFYMNGHNWLAAKLAKKKIPYDLRENAFLSIDNFPKAQELSDSIKVSDLHHALDRFAKNTARSVTGTDLPTTGALCRWNMPPTLFSRNNQTFAHVV